MLCLSCFLFLLLLLLLCEAKHFHDYSTTFSSAAYSLWPSPHGPWGHRLRKDQITQLIIRQSTQTYSNRKIRHNSTIQNQPIQNQISGLMPFFDVRLEEEVVSALKQQLIGISGWLELFTLQLFRANPT